MISRTWFRCLTSRSICLPDPQATAAPRVSNEVRRVCPVHLGPNRRLGFPRFSGEVEKGHAMTIRLFSDDQSHQDPTAVQGGSGRSRRRRLLSRGAPVQGHRCPIGRVQAGSRGAHLISPPPPAAPGRPHRGCRAGCRGGAPPPAAPGTGRDRAPTPPATPFRSGIRIRAGVC